MIRFPNDQFREFDDEGAVPFEPMDPHDPAVEAMVQEELNEPDHADYVLLTDYFDGELSAADRELVEERLRIDPEFRALADSLRMLSQLPGVVSRVPTPHDRRVAELTWESLKEQIERDELGIQTPTLGERRSSRRWRRNTIFAAIATVITGLLGTWYHPQWIPAPSFYAHLDAPRHEDLSTKLPDETEVTLVAGSHLTYLPWFSSADQRTLDLVGEATFTMAPGPRRMLLVAGVAVEVKASGGSFTVHSYEDEQVAYVYVHEGRAEVRARTLAGYGQPLKLRAGQGVRVGPDEGIQFIDQPVGSHTGRTK